MLIKVKRGLSDSTRDHIRKDDEARYVQRRGIAHVAERMKSGDPYQVSAYGQQLPHAKEMAERHSSKQLDAWKRGVRKVVVSLGSNRA